MSVEMTLLICVLLAGVYMAWNIGANDVANAMGTSVGSGALTLKQAVLLAAVLEFSGAFLLGGHVTTTVQRGIVDPAVFLQDPRILVYGMLASLLAAGAWLQIASYFGLPVSTTHSIVGSLVGFGAVVGGMEAIYWDNIGFIVSSWVLSPLCGGLLSYLVFTVLRKKIFYTPHPIESARRLTPFLIFSLLVMLSLMMLFKGLENLHLNFSFFEALGIAIAIGTIGAVVTFFLLQRLDLSSSELAVTSVPNPMRAAELDKAKKHLQRVQSSSSSEAESRVSHILEEVEELSRSFNQTSTTSSADYAVVERIFGYMQMLSAGMMAFAHGANDVANAIGPLSAAVTVLMTGVLTVETAVPLWALTLGGIGIIVGLATWGWRVIETIGRKITELTPSRGFSAEFGAVATTLVASRLGMPISTTHTLVGAVIGVGLARGIEALNLASMRDIVVSWIVTIPAGAVIAVATFYALGSIFG